MHLEDIYYFSYIEEHNLHRKFIMELQILGIGIA